MDPRKRNLPLVYSCSGCSSAAQAANHIALELDRRAVAEMSCIAGVGGNVPHLVRIARSGRPILALDGCPLACARSCLAERGLAPTRHVLLHEHGVKKRYHQPFDAAEAVRLADELAAVARALSGTAAGPGRP
ncbi:MAG TPA: putative zinc-binding protein [Usitatibacteraceae bacterium]|nr:putative zinc-binding protein [Burkholderiales bacterium]HQY47584.1 putative zinc-binding protein [Usitatibacteraceae bacterium]HRA22681.1 putative zinc-binding protein [Usitatibacteraceae bacterium]